MCLSIMCGNSVCRIVVALRGGVNQLSVNSAPGAANALGLAVRSSFSRTLVSYQYVEAYNRDDRMESIF